MLVRFVRLQIGIWNPRYPTNVQNPPARILKSSAVMQIPLPESLNPACTCSYSYLLLTLWAKCYQLSLRCPCLSCQWISVFTSMRWISRISIFRQFISHTCTVFRYLGRNISHICWISGISWISCIPIFRRTYLIDMFKFDNWNFALNFDAPFGAYNEQAIRAVQEDPAALISGRYG